MRKLIHEGGVATALVAEDDNLISHIEAEEVAERVMYVTNLDEFIEIKCPCLRSC